MKTKLFFSALMVIGFSTLSLAQRGPNNGDRYHTTYSYNSYDRGYDNSYSEYSRFGQYMNRYDRNRLNSLVRKLRERERNAWRDGHISRRESRRINDVKADINYLIAPYRNNARRDRRVVYRSSCR